MTTITLAKIGTHQTVSYAVDELARCLKLMDKSLLIDQRTYEEYDASVTGVIWVGLTPIVKEDKFEDRILIDVNDGAGVITGANNRAVLIAVYRFLHELGCAWVRPGADGEVIPKKRLDTAAISVNVDETPSYPHRCICIEGAVAYEHIFNMIEWMPRVGLNEYYIQFMSPTPFFDRWYTHLHNPHRGPEPLSVEESYHIKRRVEEEMAKRGIIYYGVGHGFTYDPFGFDTTFKGDDSPLITPEIRSYFAEVNGERKLFNDKIAFTHLCYSNPRVREIMADAVVEYVKKNPTVDYLCISLADGVNNYCECEECSKLTPSDWYVMIFNDMDAKLTAAGLDTKLVFDIYVNTMWPPIKERINNPDRVMIQFAPITRTYSAAFVDTPMDKNVEIPPYVHNKIEMPRDLGLNIALLEKWREVVDAENTIFDYHLMWDHYLDPGYTSCAKTLHRDVTTLDQLGFTGYISCQEMRLAFPTALPVYAMARGLWDKNSKFEDISREYYADMFGEDGPAVEAYLAKISELFDAKFMRNEKPEAHKTALARMDAIDALVDDFVKSHIEPNKDKDASWYYLSYHAEYCKMYAELIRCYCSEDEAKIEAQTKAFTSFHFEHEPELHTVLDSCLFDEVYQRWIKRVFANKPTDEVDF